MNATVGAGHALSWTPFVASGFPVDVSPQSGYYFPLWWAIGSVGVPATVVQMVGGPSCGVDSRWNPLWLVGQENTRAEGPAGAAPKGCTAAERR